MIIFLAFVTIGLLAAGLFAVAHGDTLIVLALLVVLVLAIIVGAPHAQAATAYLQHLIDARIPLALR